MMQTLEISIERERERERERESESEKRGGGGNLPAVNKRHYLFCNINVFHL